MTADFTDFADTENHRFCIRAIRVIRDSKPQAAFVDAATPPVNPGQNHGWQNHDGFSNMMWSFMKPRTTRTTRNRRLAETLAAIRRARGSLKRKPGDKSFAEEWAEHKREEIALEEAKYARCTGSWPNSSPATPSSKRWRKKSRSHG